MFRGEKQSDNFYFAEKITMAVMINTLESKIVTILRQAAAHLNHARFPEMSKRIDEIAGAVSTPCVVAVVGRMKSGKSSFLNALLREDLAKVGVAFPQTMYQP